MVRDFLIYDKPVQVTYADRFLQAKKPLLSNKKIPPPRSAFSKY